MRTFCQHLRNRMLHRWRTFWLARSGPRPLGRVAARIVCGNTAPYHQRAFLADLSPRGFVAPSAVLSHPDLRLGKNVYIGDNVVVTRTNDGGSVEFQDRVHLYGDTFVDAGEGGGIVIGAGTHIQPGCHLHAYLSEIRIGRHVEIAPRCGFYNYDHGMASGRPIMEQPLTSKGDIVIGDGAWIGYGVTVLEGVNIGAGAVLAAGAVVVHDVPDNAIAAGVPARVIGYRRAVNEEPLETTRVSTQSPDGEKQPRVQASSGSVRREEPISTIRT